MVFQEENSLDSYTEQLKERIKQHQKSLKRLSDDELMHIHEGMHSDLQREPDAAYLVAVSREVDRRYLAAGWIWQRKLKPEEYTKWVNHKNKTEAMAAKEIINDFSKYNDPKSQEVVKRMTEYLKQLEK